MKESPDQAPELRESVGERVDVMIVTVAMRWISLIPWLQQVAVASFSGYFCCVQAALGQLIVILMTRITSQDYQISR